MAQLGVAYKSGELGIKQDWNKAREFFIRAAKNGHLPARCCLAVNESENNNPDLAIRHFQIAAEGGVSLVMKALWKTFYRGKLSKDDLEETLRAHQNAIDRRSSEDRERYMSFEKAREGKDEVLLPLYGQYYSVNITAKELNKALKVLGYKA